MNVVVTGPESSGTRLVSRWLETHPDITARHWSMPSGEQWARHWPTDHDFDGDTPDAVVLVIRNFTATVEAQHHRQLVASRKEAEVNAITALHRTLNWCVSHGAAVTWVLYDDIVAHPERFDDVFRWLGLNPQPRPEEIVDSTQARLSCAS